LTGGVQYWLADCYVSRRLLTNFQDSIIEHDDKSSLTNNNPKINPSANSKIDTYDVLCLQKMFQQLTGMADTLPHQFLLSVISVNNNIVESNS